jgi:carbonic anhydrase/acetyltransferase-like protein (isoleucine patch superfamily)
MLIEHRGTRPTIEPTAWVAPNAVISGAVTIGPRTRVLYGAVLTADGRVPLIVGTECVIMECAVLRAAGRYPLTLGDRVLVGPHAHLSGCTIGSRSFIATGAMVFNGARLGMHGGPWRQSAHRHGSRRPDVHPNGLHRVRATWMSLSTGPGAASA